MVFQNMPEGVPRKILVQGTPAGIELAKQLIHNVLTSGPQGSAAMAGVAPILSLPVGPEVRRLCAALFLTVFYFFAAFLLSSRSPLSHLALLTLNTLDALSYTQPVDPSGGLPLHGGWARDRQRRRDHQVDPDAGRVQDPDRSELSRRHAPEDQRLGHVPAGKAPPYTVKAGAVCGRG